jgi:hypothetical protein
VIGTNDIVQAATPVDLPVFDWREDFPRRGERGTTPLAMLQDDQAASAQSSLKPH